MTFTYSVAGDCTLTITCSNSESFAGVIAADGQEIDYIETSGPAAAPRSFVGGERTSN
jgi:hypothetical protein